MVWIQAHIGLLSHHWKDIYHLYLKYLGAKISGLRWISSLIEKLWDMAWDAWNNFNHILHINKGPVKTKPYQIPPNKRNIRPSPELKIPHQYPLPINPIIPVLPTTILDRGRLQCQNMLLEKKTFKDRPNGHISAAQQ